MPGRRFVMVRQNVLFPLASVLCGDRFLTSDGDRPSGGDAGGMAATDDDHALAQRMLRKFYAVLSPRRSAAPEAVEETLPLHLNYMMSSSGRELVSASGPLTEEGGDPRGDGLTIVRVANAAEARGIAEAIPSSCTACAPSRSRPGP